MTHELKMKVRDYECDLQGIVNNANYQHYTEHARHEMLLDLGVSFADLHQRGIDAVVARITLSYKTPLRSCDEFVVRTRVPKKASAMSSRRTSCDCPTRSSPAGLRLIL